MSPSLWTRGRENMFFNTDQVRTDEQWAVFGELTYDFTESFRATFGIRHFDNTNELEGYTGWGRTNYQEDYGFEVDSKTRPLFGKVGVGLTVTALLLVLISMYAVLVGTGALTTARGFISYQGGVARQFILLNTAVYALSGALLIATFIFSS